MNFSTAFNWVSYILKIIPIINWLYQKFQYSKEQKIAELDRLRLSGVIGPEKYCSKRARLPPPALEKQF